MTGIRFFDRLTRKSLARLPAFSMPGQILIQIDTAVHGDGLPISNQDFVLSSSNENIILELPEIANNGIDASDHENYPEREVRLAYLAACRSLEIIENNKADWNEWLSISPLATGLPEQANLVPFERLLQKYLWHVEQVCAHPQTQLTIEIERLPVSRARRIPSRAYQFLANHTEDWDYQKLHSVVPRRILSTLPDDMVDFYENRLSTHLVHRLERYIAKRLGQLHRLEDIEVELELGIPTRQNRVYNLLAQAVIEGLRKSIKPTQQTLSSLYNQLLGIQDLPLYRAIPASTRDNIAPEVRATNILVKDRHYRFVNLIWKNYLHDHYTRPQTPAELQKELQDFLQSFDRYCMLLVLQALSALHFTIKQPAHLQRGISLNFHSQYIDITLLWNTEGDIVMRWGDRELVRVIPLATAITRSSDKLKIEKFIQRIRQALQTPARELRRGERRVSNVNAIGKVLLLYPGAASERQTLPNVMQREINSPGNDLRTPGIIGLLPVSPYELGCVERVGRGIRWAIFSALYLAYPLQISVPTRFEKELLSSAPWLMVGERRGVAYLGNWIDLNGKEARDHLELWNNLRGDLLRQGQQAQSQQIILLEQYWETLQKSLTGLEKLRVCPVCGQTARPENFHPDKEGIFTCKCDQRNCATWGLRKCGSCGERYPFLTAGGASRKASPVADWVDREYGLDVLSAPCPSGSHVFLCPHCGTCSQRSNEEDICQLCQSYINSSHLEDQQ